MMTVARSWVRENATLVYFLIAQAIALVSLGAYGLSYMVRLETRVSTMEVRGSPHLADINTRLTVLEGLTKSNKDSIEKISEIMLRELPVKRDQLK
jgi:hypothetical protein